MVSLVQLVEKNISVEIQHTKGAVFLDGWSAMNTHFTAVIDSYCIQQTVRNSNSATKISVPRLTLLAISPMSQQGFISGDNHDEATRFNAQCYVQFLRETFEVLDCNFGE